MSVPVIPLKFGPTAVICLYCFEISRQSGGHSTAVPDNGMGYPGAPTRNLISSGIAFLSQSYHMSPSSSDCQFGIDSKVGDRDKEERCDSEVKLFLLACTNVFCQATGSTLKNTKSADRRRLHWLLKTSYWSIQEPPANKREICVCALPSMRGGFSGIQ